MVNQLATDLSIKPLALLVGLSLLYCISAATADPSIPYTHIRTSGFIDPNIGYLYRISSFNVSSISADATHRSAIRISRVKVDSNRTPIGELEYVQTIKFHPTLVDFDTLCSPSYCYMVVVTSRTKKNVELYSWQRTQFDLLTRRDSYAKPFGVKLFRIQSSFYIAIAQEQVHLSQNRLALEHEEPVRFIGCPILKFYKGRENEMRYHQFIRLAFQPRHVDHVTSVNELNITGITNPRIHENHYVIFSYETVTQQGLLNQVHAFIWSPLNDYFWPYRLPSGAQLERKPGHRHQILHFPTSIEMAAAKPGPATARVSMPEFHESVETCFNQLQRLLIDRDMQARRLSESSRSLWRSSDTQYGRSGNGPSGLSDISARVIVHGNVIVRGSVSQSPQVALVGQQPVAVAMGRQLHGLLNSHSPALVENKVKQAFYKLKYIREKLSRAINNAFLPPNMPPVFNSKIRFLGNIQANQVIFRGKGISNSNVRINNIPFRQLEHELVSLSGAQDIVAKVIFRGDVMADTLEIHGQVNKHYFMRDALDITSNYVQIIEPSPGLPGVPALEFVSVNSKDLILSHNATFNSIRLDDFITRDTRTQVIVDRKSFKSLHTRHLQLAHPGVTLNGFNISRLARSAIRLRDAPYQTIVGGHLTFTKPIRANRLIISNLVNRHINVSALIHDTVKTNDIGLQQISGFKNFRRHLKISHLTTEGSINGVQISQIFNLNPTPPIPEYARYLDQVQPLPIPAITGNFSFNSVTNIAGNLNSPYINGIDLARQAVRRNPASVNQSSAATPQVVFGQKIFARPLRIVRSVHLVEPEQAMRNFNVTSPYIPTINGLDIKRINQGIMRQMKNPPIMYIDNLEIEGNLNLRTSALRGNQSGYATIGRLPECPVDVFRDKLVLSGLQEQLIKVPVQIDSLRARSILLDPQALNSMSFPEDFVLRSSSNDLSELLEPIHGHKSFDHIVVSSPRFANHPYAHPGSAYPVPLQAPGILFGTSSSINRISHSELQTFIDNERQHNSTGETVIQALKVYGNIFARRINGYHWPNDILLKSASSTLGPHPSLHKRIYSPLVFTETSRLDVEAQLVLRGPLQLNGRLNGVNLTEFSAQSVTYGDKALLSLGRPLRNKVFAGGITVTGDFRSQGLIDGVQFEDMKRRVVTIGSQSRRIQVTAPKSFLSDLTFAAPLNIVYLNELPMNQYLSRIRLLDHPSGLGKFIQISGKKTVTGALRINQNLFVIGNINGINFVDLQARAIPLTSINEGLKFNKTLTIEGDAFMDNLLIDEKDGILDGVRLTNLLPIETIGRNELVLSAPSVTRHNLSSTQGQYRLNVAGSVHDCQISCSLQVPETPANVPRPTPSHSLYPTQVYDLSPKMPPAPQAVVMPPRPVSYMGRNITFMRTTPPYTMQMPVYTSPPPIPIVKRAIQPDQRLVLRNLATRRPIGIKYDLKQPESMQVRVTSVQTVSIQTKLSLLRNQIISSSILGSHSTRNLVIGFIDTETRDIGNLLLPDQSPPHLGDSMNPNSFMLLDQIDFPFTTATYHMSVGVSTVPSRVNITRVFSSLHDGGPVHELSILPVDAPNSAMFLHIPSVHALFLLISQDSSSSETADSPTCPSKVNSNVADYYSHQSGIMGAINGVHVYLFHALQNSSSLTSSYFDLYQTIDLPSIDSFDNFSYRGSTYILAISRAIGRIYLLVNRGYTGFQIVSHVDIPSLESIRIIFTADQRPVLIIFLSDGSYKLMDSVVI